MKNIKELRETLAQNYEQLRTGEISVGQCSELSNTAGKVMNSVKIEMEYNRLTGNQKHIKFMEYGNDEVEK